MLNWQVVKKFLSNFNFPSLLMIFLLALILRLAISVPFYSGDVGNHVVWGRTLAEDGLAGFYQRSFPNVVFPTYGPLGMLPFGLAYLFFIFLVNFTWFLNTSIPPFPSNLVYFFSFENYNLLAAVMKLSGIFGDLAVAGLIYLFVANIFKLKNPKVYPVLYLANPAVFYLSAVWGQFESLVLAFALGSLFFTLRKKPVVASIFFTFSLLTKQTAVFFAPIFYILFFKTFGLKKTLQSVIITAATFYLFYLPFGFLNPVETFDFYFKTFSYVTDRVYENAFNLWYLIFAPEKPLDFEVFAGISYQLWSFLLFIIFTLPAAFLLLKKKSPKLVILTTLYLLLTSFLFLTRIHERYLAFLLPFTLLAIPVNFSNFFLIYLLISAIHILNLYNGFFQPNIPAFNFLVDNLIIVRILIILLVGVLIYISLQVWKNFNAKT